jgi:hypothetical protein
MNAQVRQRLIEYWNAGSIFKMIRATTPMNQTLIGLSHIVDEVISVWLF